MNKYNFDEMINREDTYSSKWSKDSRAKGTDRHGHVGADRGRTEATHVPDGRQ